MQRLDECNFRLIDPKRVAAVKARMPSEADVVDTAYVFGLLGDPRRLKLLVALLDGELCVCDLAAVSGMCESATSHALRLLRAHRVVSVRRDGRMAYYRLDEQAVTGHGHEHGHAVTATADRRCLSGALALILTFMAAEVVRPGVVDPPLEPVRAGPLQRTAGQPPDLQRERVLTRWWNRDPGARHQSAPAERRTQEPARWPTHQARRSFPALSGR
jgi:DNA-binding transcriptional ArsR family regulator